MATTFLKRAQRGISFKQKTHKDTHSPSPSQVQHQQRVVVVDDDYDHMQKSLAFYSFQLPATLSTPLSPSFYTIIPLFP